MLSEKNGGGKNDLLTRVLRGQWIRGLLCGHYRDFLDGRYHLRGELDLYWVWNQCVEDCTNCYPHIGEGWVTSPDALAKNLYTSTFTNYQCSETNTRLYGETCEGYGQGQYRVAVNGYIFSEYPTAEVKGHWLPYGETLDTYIA